MLHPLLSFSSAPYLSFALSLSLSLSIIDQKQVKQKLVQSFRIHSFSCRHFSRRMAFFKIGTSETNYHQNIGSHAQNNNVHFGDSGLKKQEPTAVQKAIEKTGEVFEKGGDLITSWIDYVRDVMANFSFYLIIIVVILLLALSLYIGCRCYCYRHGKKLSTEKIVDIFTIMTAKNSSAQSSPPPTPPISNKF